MTDKQILLELRANSVKLEKDMAKIHGQINKQAGKMAKEFSNRFSSSLTRLGIGAALTAGLKSAFDSFRAFDKGLRNVNTIINVSEEELKGYKTELLSLSRQLGLSGEDLTNAFYQAASAGVSAGNAIKFIEVAGKAAVAGLSTTETAVDGLTTVLNSYQLSTSEAGRVSDILFQTVKLGKTTFGELAAQLAQVTPIAAANGIEFEQVAAMIASLTKQGVPTAQAVTQIRAAIIGLNENLGDGWANSMSLQEGFQAIAKSAGGSQTKLKEMIGRIEGVSAVLSATGDNARGAASDLEAMVGSLGATDAAFGEQTKSIEFKFNRLNKALESVGIALMGYVAGPLTDAAEGIVSLISPTSSLTEQFKSQKEKVETLDKSIAPLLDKYDQLLPLAEDNKDKQDELKTVIGKIAALLPGAITKWDQYGNAISLSKDKVLELMAAEKARLQFINKNAIKDAEEQRENLKKEIDGIVKTLDEGYLKITESQGIMGASVKTERFKPLSDEQINDFRGKLKSLQGDLLGVNEQLKYLKGETSTYEAPPPSAGGKKGGSKKPKAKKLSVPLIFDDSDMVEIRKETEKLIEDLTAIEDEFTENELSSYEEKMNRKKELLGTYYESVKFLDSDYMNYKLAGIDAEVEKLREAGLTEIELARFKQEEIKNIESEYYDWKWEMWKKDNEFAVNSLNVLGGAYDNFFSSLTDRTLTGSQRLQNMYADIKGGFVAMLGDMLKNFIANQVKTALLSKTSQALETASAAATGGAIAAAYAPAAAFANIATFGGASIAGAAGLASTVALAQALAIPKFAQGGDFVVPPGYQNDSYPMLVQSGERVQVTPSNRAGDESRLLAQLISRVEALNLNLVKKDFKVDVHADVDAIKFQKQVNQPAARKLNRAGYKNAD